MEPRKHYFAKIPTIAIFIVMAMSGPLGVLLFILKGIDQKMQKEEQEAARDRGDYRPSPNPAPMPKTPPFPGQDFPTAEQKSAKPPARSSKTSPAASVLSVPTASPRTPKRSAC